MSAGGATRQTQLEACAELLLRARFDVAQIPELPEALRPRTLEEAYAISDLIADRLGLPVGGWFCGATNPAIRDRLGLREPYCARIFAPVIHESPAVIPARTLTPAAIEIEVAVRLGADLPPRERPYTAEEVRDAIDTVHPAIDLVAGHLENWMDQDPLSVIADNGTDGAAIIGAPYSEWRGIDLADLGVSVRVNGAEVRTGHSSRVDGGPLNAMTWLANAHRVHGGLRRGHVHNTGTLTAPLPIDPGDRIEAVFDTIGSVSLHLAGA